MIKGRNLDNLGGESDAIEALSIIRHYFGEGYLNANNNHKLPKLWARLDRLATVELYVFGKCLLKIAKENEKWLLETIRGIKRQSPDSSHGFFTEILFLGMFGLHRTKILPAEKSKSGYDFSVEFPNDIRHLISVKNIDASESNKVFQRNSRRLRKKWIGKIKSLNIRAGIRVVSDKSLVDSDFDDIITIFKNIRLSSLKRTYQINKDIKAILFNLPEADYSSSSKFVSDIVQIFCPPPVSEYKRYVKKIRSAVSNIRKHTVKGDNTSLVVFIRVHVHADYNFISDQVKEMINEDSSTVDCVICYQPSYVRDEKNSSLLNHSFKIEASARFAIRMAGSDWYKVDIPLGSSSLSQSDVKVVDLETGDEEFLSASDYFFQQGDLYINAKKEENGSLYCDDIGSPAIGIRKHGVFQGLVVTSKSTVEHEELLII